MISRKTKGFYQFLSGFVFAFNGIKCLFRNERNFKIQVVIMLCVMIAGFLLKISSAEWLFVVFAIGLVLALEAANTGIEYLSDFISPKKNDSIKKVKDVMAASVLIGSSAALIIGILIFFPKVIELIRG